MLNAFVRTIDCVSKIMISCIRGNSPKPKKGYNHRFNIDTVLAKYEIMSVPDIVEGYAHHCLTAGLTIDLIREGNGTY